MAQSPLRQLSPKDMDWAYALNQANGEALSFMERDAFEALVRRACFAWCVDPDDGFLLAFDAPPTDDSPNFNWFAKRYRRFIYVDRIAVAEHARRQGVAARLYQALFAVAADAGHTIVGAEVNADPPNLASDAFHAAQGFSIVGEARLIARNKTVRYFTRIV